MSLSLTQYAHRSSKEDLKEAKDLIVEVWVLEPQLIEVVSSDWLLEIVLEGRDVDTGNFVL